MKLNIPRTMSLIAMPIIMATVFFAVLKMKTSSSEISLPDYGVAPGFQLTDQSGAAFDAKSLKGKAWIGAFMFTRCPDACPLMVLKLAKISKRNPAMNFVSFSSDPDFDKPEILKEYVGRGVGPQNWTFLTGSKDELKKVSAALMMANSDSPNLHSTRFVLVDKGGHIRGFYDSQSSEQLTALAVDARGLI